MSDFNRRIDERAIAVLKDLAKSDGNWWHDLLSLWSPSGSAGGLRLAIRNGYMNFYSCGQSIAKVSFGPRHNEPVLQVHEKYVTGQSSGGQRYAAFPAHGGKWGGPGTLRSWISNSTGHRGIEKPLIEETIGAAHGALPVQGREPRNTADGTLSVACQYKGFRSTVEGHAMIRHGPAPVAACAAGEI